MALDFRTKLLLRQHPSLISIYLRNAKSDELTELILLQLEVFMRESGNGSPINTKLDLKNFPKENTDPLKKVSNPIDLNKIDRPEDQNTLGEVPKSTTPKTPEPAITQKIGNVFSLIGANTGNNVFSGIGQISSSITNAANNWVSKEELQKRMDLARRGLDKNAGDKAAAKVLKEVLTQNNANIMGIAGGVADAARGMFFSDLAANDSAVTSGINLAYDAVSSSLMAFSPIGTMIGGAMKVGALVGDLAQSLGGGTDLMTTADQIMDSSFFSWNVGLINGFGGSKTLNFSANKDTLTKVGSDYGGSVDSIGNAAGKAGKKYGLFSSGAKRRVNRLIDKARGFLNTMTSIAKDATNRHSIATATHDYNALNYQNQLNGDDIYMSLRAKQGAKLIRLRHIIDLNSRRVEKIDSSWEPAISLKLGGIIEKEWEPEITLLPEFKEGGVIEEEWTPTISLKTGGKVEYTPLTELKNVIPDGALHKNKHHMENADGLTKKGIPVIDNDGEQLAEIELNEIIFSLEVTKKLENWYYTFYNENTSNKEKDEVAIEAGKLLVQEILFNTEDNTGLIDSLKNGGKINGGIE